MIAAEGEQKASRALREAAETIADSHSALQVHAILHAFYHMCRTNIKRIPMPISILI